MQTGQTGTEACPKIRKENKKMTGIYSTFRTSTLPHTAIAGWLVSSCQIKICIKQRIVLIKGRSL